LVFKVDAMTASKIVLLDSIMSNIDRTAKNTNLLNWNKELWVIDNGASFYFHHNWETWKDHLKRTFPLIKDHVLLEFATKLKEAALVIRGALGTDIISEIIGLIPEEWLLDEADDLSPVEIRAAYKEYLDAKLAMIDTLVKEAENAR
jgi:uncharacterized protein (UPF0216 family)